MGAVVRALPGGCSATLEGGVTYYNCGGVIYKPFYQGSNVVYEVVRY
ncbi:hypothetical protein [Leptolyngbya sp. Cla-17]